MIRVIINNLKFHTKMKSKETKKVNLKKLNLEKLKVTSLNQVKGGDDPKYTFGPRCTTGVWC